MTEDQQASEFADTLLKHMCPEVSENPPDFRANPTSNYWRWLWNRDSLSFGLFAPWVAWQRYQAMLDAMEARRRRNYTPTIGAYWIKATAK